MGVFLDRNNRFKDFPVLTVLHTGKTFTKPAGAGKKVNYGDGKRRLHRTVLGTERRQQIAPSVQD